MNNAARRIERHDARREVKQEVATVVSKDGSGFTVRIDDVEVPAARATSCLVEPIAGDCALVAIVPQGSAYILAILEREAGAGARLVADGDLEVKLDAGKFSVAAQEGVDLLSGGRVGVIGKSFDVSAVEGNFLMERLTLIGKVAQAKVEKAKLLATSLDSVLDTLSQKVKRSLRMVDDIEQVRAERIDCVARKELNMRAKNALLTAQELVKIDGEQIHVG